MSKTDYTTLLSRIKEVLEVTDDYRFKWKVLTGRRPKLGVVCDCVASNGYRVIRIDNKLHTEHRLMFLWHHGYLPKYIDHIDGNRLNNHINNLREATNSQNCMNRGKQSNNTSGHSGVGWRKNRNRWDAKIKINGKVIGLGFFKEKEDAIKARKDAELIYFKEFTHHG